jgi:hypothetical protein
VTTLAEIPDGTRPFNYLALGSSAVYYGIRNTAGVKRTYIASNDLADGGSSSLGFLTDEGWDGVSPIKGIAVNATNLYFTWTDGTDGYIKTTPVGGVLEFTTLAKISGSPTPVPNALTIDDNNVYWTDTGTLKVMKVPLAGGKHHELASGVTSSGIAVEGTTVYWTDSALGTVSSIPRAGGSPSTLVTGVNDPTMLVAIASSLFWLDPADDAVLSAPLAGGTATTLATGQVGLAGIATDGTSVYWTAQGTGTTTGTVMKLTPK